MVNRTKVFNMPDGTATRDVDEYIGAWHKLAEPLEREFGLTLFGFDPSMQFRKGNPHGAGAVHIDLPTWFVRDLGNKLGYLEQSDRSE